MSQSPSSQPEKPLHNRRVSDETAVPHVPMSPGDEAPAGTPGTGQNVCRRCGGSGQDQGKECAECEGSGYVITGIGGA